MINYFYDWLLLMKKNLKNEIYICHTVNNLRRIIEKVAVDILWYIWAASEINSQKEILQPDPDKNKIKTNQKRGIELISRATGIGFIATIMSLIIFLFLI